MDCTVQSGSKVTIGRPKTTKIVLIGEPINFLILFLHNMIENGILHNLSTGSPIKFDTKFVWYKQTVPKLQTRFLTLFFPNHIVWFGQAVQLLAIQIVQINFFISISPGLNR